jgi:hypothetical protein
LLPVFQGKTHRLTFVIFRLNTNVAYAEEAAVLKVEWTIESRPASGKMNNAEVLAKLRLTMT